MIAQSLLILSILFNTIGASAFATKFDTAYVKQTLNQASTVEASNNQNALPEIGPRPFIQSNSTEAIAYAKNYVLVDSDTGIVLAGQNEHNKVPIASTTKIMTAILVLENYKLDDIITISQKAATEIGATADFQTGEKITVRNLLEAMLIKSVNGAADAFAEHMNNPNETGMTKFVQMMNAKAKELGMKDTQYHDPAGLDVTGYSSAYDLYLATKYALTKPTFAQIVTIKETSVTDVTGMITHTLQNSNRLVRDWDYPGAIGVKTGYMPEAGHCLVGAAKRDGHTLIAVVLSTDADTAPASAEEARRLLDWGWQNVYWAK